MFDIKGDGENKSKKRFRRTKEAPGLVEAKKDEGERRS